MGVRFPSAVSTAIIGNGGAGPETVICTTPPINQPLDSAPIILLWSVAMTTGSPSVTGFIFLLRRGTTTAGTLVNVSSTEPGSTGLILRRSGMFVDMPGVIAEQQYSLTVTQPGASAAGSIQEVCLIAFVL